MVLDDALLVILEMDYVRALGRRDDALDHLPDPLTRGPRVHDIWTAAVGELQGPTPEIRELGDAKRRCTDDVDAARPIGNTHRTVVADGRERGGQVEDVDGALAREVVIGDEGDVHEPTSSEQSGRARVRLRL